MFYTGMTLKLKTHLFPNPYFFFPLLVGEASTELAVSSSPSGTTDARLSPDRGVSAGIVPKQLPFDLTEIKQLWGQTDAFSLAIDLNLDLYTAERVVKARFYN